MALVGLGAMSDNILDSLPRINGLELVAVVEPRDDRRQAIAAKYHVQAFSDYGHMLSEARDKIDLVYIASPNEVHESQATAAIQAGLAIILQKPIAINQAGADAIIKAWQAKKTFLYVGFELRLSRMFCRVKDLIDEGRIGNVRDVAVNYYAGLWPVWFEHDGGWKYTRKGAGSMFAEKLCHSIDLMRHWSGQEFVEVTAYAPSSPIVPYFEIADNLHAIFRLSGGATGRISFSFTRASAVRFDPGPANFDPDERQGHSYDFSVIGDKGSIWLNVDRKFLTLVTHQMRKGQFTPSLERVEDFSSFTSNKDLYHDNESELQCVVDRLSAGEDPPIMPMDSYRSMLGAYRAQQSLDEGRTIAF